MTAWRRRLGLAALCGALHTAALAGWDAVPPRADMTQRLDAALPLDLPFVDADAHPVRLGDYFADGRPVVLVLGYHRCSNLCGLAMHGVLEALAATGLPPSSWRVLAVSIDPRESPADAYARREVDRAYAAQLGGAGAARFASASAGAAHRGAAVPAMQALPLQRLVGPAGSIDALAGRIGFVSAAEHADADDASRYAHPTGLVVVTPSGRTSRYLLGIRFDAGELRQALRDAAAGRIGTPVDRLLLLCAHFDPRRGRHDGAVMNGLRAVGIAIALALGTYAWRHRHARADRRP